MSIPAKARKDAWQDFFPGRPQPKDYRFKDAYYRGCYDEAWQKLEKGAAEDAEQERLKLSEPPTLEERVETLEQQLAELREALQRWIS